MMPEAVFLCAFCFTIAKDKNVAFMFCISSAALKLQANSHLTIQHQQELHTWLIKTLTAVTCGDLGSPGEPSRSCTGPRTLVSSLKARTAWAPMLHHLHPTCVPAGGALPEARWECEDRCRLDWCFCVKWGRAQRSLGSIVEPRSTRAGDAPDQELLGGAPHPTQPAVLWPLCQLMQRAAEARTGQHAGAFHVSSAQYQP